MVQKVSEVVHFCSIYRCFLSFKSSGGGFGVKFLLLLHILLNNYADDLGTLLTLGVAFKKDALE